MNHIGSRWPKAAGIALGLGLLSVATASAVDVNVLAWDPNFNGAAMTEAAARYTAIHPDVNIVIDTSLTQADVRAKLQTQLLAGQTQGLPDIVLIQDDVAQKYLQSFPGAFEPLSDHIDMSKFAQYKVAAATLDGKSYSVPFDSGVAGLFYRSDYFEAAGFTSKDLQDITWDRLIEIGKAVKEKTGHLLFGLDVTSSSLIRVLMQSGGEWYFNADGSLHLTDNAAFKKALEVYQKLWAAGLIKPVSGGTESNAAFTSGEVAAVTTGVWIIGTIKANAAADAGKWAVAPIPKLEGVDKAVHASNQGGSSWYVLASAPQKAAAIDFLKTVWAGDVEFYQKILVDRGAVGALLAAREGPAYQSADDFFGGQTIWKDFSSWLAMVPSVSYGIYTAEVNSAVAAQLPAISEGGDIDAAIEKINAEATQAIQ